jgi:hypothetical protein
MTNKKQRAAAKRNIKKAAKAARGKENNCAFAEKDAYRPRKKRSESGPKEKALKIKVA